jgi:epsin
LATCIQSKKYTHEALTVIEYLLENGPEDVVSHYKRKLAAIKTLKEYQYIDENGHDQGANVRQKSKQVSGLLTDDSKLRELRSNRGTVRDRIGYSRPSGEYDDDLQRAIEASKEQAQMDERMRQKRQEEYELQRAIELSEQEALQKRMNQRDQWKDFVCISNNVEMKRKMMI